MSYHTENHTDHHSEDFEPCNDCMVNGMDANDYLVELSLRKQENS